MLASMNTVLAWAEERGCAAAAFDTPNLELLLAAHLGGEGVAVAGLALSGEGGHQVGFGPAPFEFHTIVPFG